MFNLPNIVDDGISVTQYQWKTMVRKAIHAKYEDSLKNIIQKSIKLKNGPMLKENFEEQKYMKDMSMNDARTLFGIRSKTTQVKMNQRSDKENSRSLWKCSECGNVDSQSHILWCPFHSKLM